MLVLVFLGGVWLGRGGVDGAASPTLRPSELPGPDVEVQTGGISYRVVGWRCGIVAVQGDQADWLADGQYCRMRVRMTSADGHVHIFEAAPQARVDLAGQ